MLLPKIDTGATRGNPRDFPARNSQGGDAVVSLPRLRLLKQVGGGDAPSISAQLPPPLGEKYGGGSSGSGTPVSIPRGRSLLRPLHSEKGRPSVARSPSLVPLPRESSSVGEEFVDVMQQHARERVREHNKHRKRRVREEEERRMHDEKERVERAQKKAPDIEQHRRELARRAGEQQRRLRADHEAQMKERDELESVRRERAKRYMTPDKIAEWRQLDGLQPREIGNVETSAEKKPPMPSRPSRGETSRAPSADGEGHTVRRGRRRHGGGGAKHRGSGSNDSGTKVSAVSNRMCSCGNKLLADSVFCRMCGVKCPTEVPAEESKPIDDSLSDKAIEEPSAARLGDKDSNSEPADSGQVAATLVTQAPSETAVPETLAEAEETVSDNVTSPPLEEAAPIADGSAAAETPDDANDAEASADTVAPAQLPGEEATVGREPAAQIPEEPVVDNDAAAPAEGMTAEVPPNDDAATAHEEKEEVAVEKDAAETAEAALDAPTASQGEVPVGEVQAEVAVIADVASADAVEDALPKSDSS